MSWGDCEQTMKIAELEAKLVNLEYEFACYLSHTTNGRISKPNGTAEEMIVVFDQARSDLVEELINDGVGITPFMRGITPEEHTTTRKR